MVRRVRVARGDDQAPERRSVPLVPRSARRRSRGFADAARLRFTARRRAGRRRSRCRSSCGPATRRCSPCGWSIRTAPRRRRPRADLLAESPEEPADARAVAAGVRAEPRHALRRAGPDPEVQAAATSSSAAATSSASRSSTSTRVSSGSRGCATHASADRAEQASSADGRRDNGACPIASRGTTSPYLRQHAGNPVDWYPWGEEALARAQRPRTSRSCCRSATRPATGATSWRTSRSRTPDVAAAMNAAFVNIKVDREERPDLDQIYQTAHALMTRRSGGWPLTMFLTPDGAPFFGGTYFPKTCALRPARLPRLLPRVAAAYREQGAAIAEQSAPACRARSQSLEPSRGTAPRFRSTRRACAPSPSSSSAFDPVDGGFGGAPKFPHAAELEFCLREWSAARRRRGALAVVTHDARAHGRRRHPRPARRRLLPLQRRRRSGRSRTSRRCSTTTRRCSRCMPMPRARRATRVRRRRARHRRLARARDARARRRVLLEPRRRQRRRGGQVLRVDARRGARRDASGRMGRGRAVLRASTAPPNFEGHAWNLRVVASVDDVAAQPRHRRCPMRKTRLAGARAALFAARAKRVRPGLDDKILTAWNALTIAALARAARALDEPALGRSRVRRARCARRARRGATGACTRRATAATSALNGIPRRLRVPARRVARVDADALSPQDWDLGARDCRPPARRASRTAIAAVSGSRATTTKRCITGRSPRTTTRRRRETASPRRRCSRWDIWRRSRVTSRPRSARCGCSRTDSPNPRRRSRRCWWRSTDCTRRPPHSSLAAIRQRRAIGSDIWSMQYRPDLAIVVAVGEAVPEALRKGTVQARVPRHGCARGCSAYRRSPTCRRSKRNWRHPFQRLRRWSAVPAEGRLIWPVDAAIR